MPTKEEKLGNKIRKDLQAKIDKTRQLSLMSTYASFDAIRNMDTNLKNVSLPSDTREQTSTMLNNNNQLVQKSNDETTTKLRRQLRAYQNLDKIQNDRMILEKFNPHPLYPDINEEEYQSLKTNFDALERMRVGLNNSDINSFNELKDQKNDLNKEIFDKDKLIIINENNQYKKDRIIMALRPLLILFILMILPVYLLLAGFISVKLGLMVIAASTIITLIVITVQQVKSHDNVEKSIVRKNITTAKDFGRSLVQTLLPESVVKKCPSTCSPKPNFDNDFTYTRGNEVWLDNPINVWRDGQVPTVAGNKDILGEAKNKGYSYVPKPAFGAPTFATEHKCVYNSNVDKMTDMERAMITDEEDNSFITKYPCQYWPGFKEKKN